VPLSDASPHPEGEHTAPVERSAPSQRRCGGRVGGGEQAASLLVARSSSRAKGAGKRDASWVKGVCRAHYR
jgi:hypothetical protein